MSTYTLYHPESRKPVTVDRRTEAALLKQGYTRNPNAPKSAASTGPAGKPAPAAQSAGTPSAPIDVSDPLAAIANAKGKAGLFAVAKALGTRVPDEIVNAPDVRAFLLEAHKPVESPAPGESDGAAADDGDAADDTGDLI